jgi:Collagen triple helix repeat (20 copies)
MRFSLAAAALLLAACSKSSGTEGAEGPPGPPGPQGNAGDAGASGPAGPAGPAGSAGPAGTSVSVSSLAAGDTNCPQGGVQLTVGTTVTYVCNGGGNGPAGPQGPAGPAGTQGPAGPAGALGPVGATGAAGAQGPAGPAGAPGAAGAAGAAATLSQVSTGNANCPYGGTQITVSGTTTYACNGAPGGGGTATYNGGIPPVTLAGYTTQTYTGNLNGRSGAHALCNAAFTGSYFCTDWQIDQAAPGPMSGASAWVDYGDNGGNSRYFRQSYQAAPYETCNGWTNSAPNPSPGGNLVSGEIVTSLGDVTSSFVGNGDGGCENQRPLACCKGGTAVRFRGFTSPATGNLAGRSGAHAMCAASFTGSHFCTDWEVDQAAVPAPIAANGVWVDYGNGSPGNTDPLGKNYRQSYEAAPYETCNGWTNSLANPSPGGNLVTGETLTALGGISSSFVGSGDGGCEDARPVACCDGYPPL